MLPREITFDLYEAFIDAYYRYSQCVGSAVARMLPPGRGGVFVDAGAYIGFKALGFADYIGPQGKVLMIEICGENEALARRNISQNRLDNRITSFNSAIWKEAGEMTDRSRGYSAHTLVETSEHMNWHGRSTVAARTLDSIFTEAGLDEINYLNLQLNGAELEALEGLSRYFDRVQVIRSAGQFTRDGVLGMHLVADHLEARGCYVERKRNTVLAVTPRFRARYLGAC